jgi:predicted RNA-binding protein with PIN domain
MQVLIVDGYNVIHAWPRLKRALSERGLEDARRLLIQALSEYAAQTGVAVTVVFDAHSRVGDRNAAESIDGVTVRYGTTTASADHVIERLANEASRHGNAADVVVATGDRLQRSMVTAMGAGTMSAKALEEEVTSASHTANDARRHRDEATGARRVEHQLDPDVRRRLEALRRGQPDDGASQ